MLRRVARALRLLLFVVGLHLLLLWGASFSLRLTVLFDGSVVGASLKPGTVEVWGLGLSMRELYLHEAFITRPRLSGLSLRTFLGWWSGLPDYVEIPLWLPAFLCLVWPVTSFIVARRRRKARGFEVEASSGAPKVRQEPEPGISPRV